MKLTRILESICVPLALAYAGWYATPLATKLITLLGREYVTMSITAVVRAVLLTSACGLAAGVAAVVAQRRKEGRRRWSFYAVVALSMPIGAALIFVIEAIRPRFEGAFGFPPMRADISSVPLWILAVGFWLPFLIFLRKKAPNQPPQTTTGSSAPDRV